MPQNSPTEGKPTPSQATPASPARKKQYLRIGSSYWIKAEKPLASGDTLIKLVPWSRQNIRDDETDKEILKKIPKYLDFVCVPGHLDYQQTVGDFYNVYEPFGHQPEPGPCPNSLRFVRHIFGEHYDLGLDYLKLLLEKPTQKLPVLSLVSRQRETGKTTFLNWLKAIYKGNMSICRSKDFESQFNSEWVFKRIVAIDETFLEKKATSETLKALSTARNITMEAKGKDREQVEFCGVVILCTNNETDFVKIDDEETRYWVRQVLKMETDDAKFLEKLIGEIPAFLQFLVDRSYITQQQGRMWFSQQQIFTEALARLKAEGRNTLEKEMEAIIDDQIETFEVDEISFTAGDFAELLKSMSGAKFSPIQITTVLRERWGMSQENTTYPKYHWTTPRDGEPVLSSTVQKGRRYLFKRNWKNAKKEH